MNRYYDRLLPLFRQFLLLPNRSDKLMNLPAIKRRVIDINSLSYLPGVSGIGICGELTHGKYEGVRSLSSNVNYTRQSTMEGRPEECTFFVRAFVSHCHTAK